MSLLSSDAVMPRLSKRWKYHPPRKMGNEKSLHYSVRCGRRWSVQGAETSSGEPCGRLSLDETTSCWRGQNLRRDFPPTNHLPSTDKEKTLSLPTGNITGRSSMPSLIKNVFVHAKQSKTSTLGLSCAADCGSLTDLFLGSPTGGVCAQTPRGSDREETYYHFI